LSDKKYFNLPEIVHLHQIQKKGGNVFLVPALEKSKPPPQCYSKTKFTQTLPASGCRIEFFGLKKTDRQRWEPKAAKMTEICLSWII
jgi:hypothetical protein